jgi:hypothetical protein
MTKQKLVKRLLKANPKARKQEQVIRETMKDLAALRRQGFGGPGYRLIVPFGDKQLRADEGLARRLSK